MYHPIQLASFSLMHFEYFLEDLSGEDARRRIRKEDGTEMNAISWIVGHVSWQWMMHALGAAPGPDERLEKLLEEMARFGNRPGSPTDPTPPSLADARRFLHEARDASRWIVEAQEADLDREGREGFRHPSGQNQGSLIMRSTLHTWCHGGEINAIRQMLGHPEVPFVMFMPGNIEWLPAGSEKPAWGEYPPVMEPSSFEALRQRTPILPPAPVTNG